MTKFVKNNLIETKTILRMGILSIGDTCSNPFTIGPKKQSTYTSEEKNFTLKLEPATFAIKFACVNTTPFNTFHPEEEHAREE